MALDGGGQRHHWCFSYVISEYREGNEEVYANRTLQLRLCSLFCSNLNI